MALPAAGMALLLYATALAQAPPAPPNPQAPSVNMPVPTGLRRGTSVELKLTGSNLADPTGLWTGCPARAIFPADNRNGKDQTRLRARLEVAKDAPLGLYAMRLATTHGLSNLRLFAVDDLPEIREGNTNRSLATAQPVPVPCVVVGHADPEASDYFRFAAQAGQRISFEVLGRRLGSPLDPQLKLFDARTAKELDDGYSNDAPGLQTDPRLTYTFKTAGQYVVEVRDTQWAGGPEYWYRLRIGDFPCATNPVPMAARRGRKTLVHFAGPTVVGVPPVEVSVPDDPATQALWVTPRGANGLSGWPVVLGVSDLDEQVEKEPNNEPRLANRIPVPGAITGQFQERGDVDHFVFAARKGQHYVIDAQTLELFSPALVTLTLRDPRGTTLARTDPQLSPPADQRIDFTAPADGDVVVAVEHLLYAWGPTETYRLSVVPYEPGFTLALNSSRFEAARGTAVAVPVFVSRHDYAGPIEVSAIGFPAWAGRAVIPAGSPLAPNQPACVLFLNAPPDLPPGPYRLAIQGRATINGKVVSNLASVRAAISRDLASLPYPPPMLTNEAGVAVTSRAPFVLSAKIDRSEALRGTPFSLTITATRDPGFTDEIALSPLGLPPTVAPAFQSIPKGQNAVTVQLTPALAAPLGKLMFGITGKLRSGNQEHTVTVGPVSLTLVSPFDLKVEPPSIAMPPGGKAAVKVSAVRHAGYNGPIALEFRNLPPGVTAPSVAIPPGQTRLEIPLTAATTAAPGSSETVQVQGTAPAAGNQQANSSGFRVAVAMK